MKEHGELVLASSSPRRREILGRLGLKFEVRTPDVEEKRRPQEPAADFARRAAAEKAAAVAEELAAQGRTPCVIGADTVVVLDDKPLGKPADSETSREMLTALSGREHVVLTGWVVLDAKSGARREGVEATTVRFKELRPDEIDGYVASGEGLDKAGAYGIQGLGCFLVERIGGNYENVVGLPACPIVEALRSLGVVSTFP